MFLVFLISRKIISVDGYISICSGSAFKCASGEGAYGGGWHYTGVGR
jgi:hypothetical protein